MDRGIAVTYQPFGFTDAYQAVLGDDDPETLMSRYEPALCLRRQAETELRAVLAARRRAPGDDAPDTAQSRQALTEVLRERGVADEAVPKEGE